MAKFNELFEDVQQLFDEVISIADLERVMDIKVITNDKMKEIGKVQKTNDMTKYLTGGVDTVITINQLIFTQLPKDMQEMVAIELVTYISYDDEKERVIISKPDVNTFSGVLRKYGYENYERLQLSIKSLYNKEQNDEDGQIVDKKHTIK